jgi:quinol-cytochrome oxidoreductase complex cytochrome b subunit
LPDDNTNNQRFRRSLIWHLRPALVPERAIRFTHTFGLGGMALVLVFLLVFTGILMVFSYEPSPERAWVSVSAFQEDVLFGRLIRGVHFWSANLLIPVTLLHLLRVFLTGGFHGRRSSNWLLGLGVLACVLLSGFTGYLLPWDQTAYWAITICTEMLGLVPGIGPGLQAAMVGGSEIGSATIINFYALHIVLTPMLLFALLSWHFWQIRKAGGVVLPAAPVDNIREAYRTVPMVPNLFIKEVVVALVLIALVLLLAIFAAAPLGEPANPGISPNPAKAPWYFLGFQELLIHFDATFAILVIPLLAAAALIAIPFIPYDADIAGNWFLTPKGRHMALVAAVTALVVAPLWVVIDDRVIGPEGWLPGTATVISNGLVPFALLLAGATAFYLAIKKYFGATRNETVQALFVLVVVAFTVLTATGAWFRGPGMTLVSPWPT